MTYILQCCELKRPGFNAAQDLYCSQVFNAGKRWLIRHGHKWVIFSAKYGILQPDAIVCDYDIRFGSPHAITVDILRSQKPQGPLVSLCGKVYDAKLKRAGFQFTNPLAGLGCGERNSWFNNDGRILYRV